MSRLLKRICFVVPMGLANLADDLCYLLSLGYARGPFLAMRFSMWWFNSGFGQY